MRGRGFRERRKGEREEREKGGREGEGWVQVRAWEGEVLKTREREGELSEREKEGWREN